MLLLLIENGNDRLKAEQLYEQYRYLMFSQANKILQDKHLAEDAVQQSFLVILLINERGESYAKTHVRTKQEQNLSCNGAGQ